MFDTEWHRLLKQPQFEVIESFFLPVDAEQINAAKRAFESCLESWFQVVRSQTACAASAQLNFVPPAELSLLLNREVHADQVADVASALVDLPLAESDPDALAPTIYAGFAEAVAFLDGFVELSQFYAAENQAPVRQVIRKIAQLLRWRFFFLSDQRAHVTGHNASEDGRSVATIVLDRYLHIFHVSATESFQRYLRKIIDGWMGLQGEQFAYASA